MFNHVNFNSKIFTKIPTIFDDVSADFQALGGTMTGTKLGEASRRLVVGDPVYRDMMLQLLIYSKTHFISLPKTETDKSFTLNNKHGRN